MPSNATCAIALLQAFELTPKGGDGVDVLVAGNNILVGGSEIPARKPPGNV